MADKPSLMDWNTQLQVCSTALRNHVREMVSSQGTSLSQTENQKLSDSAQGHGAGRGRAKVYSQVFGISSSYLQAG